MQRRAHAPHAWANLHTGRGTKCSVPIMSLHVHVHGACGNAPGAVHPLFPGPVLANPARTPACDGGACCAQEYDGSMGGSTPTSTSGGTQQVPADDAMGPPPAAPQPAVPQYVAQGLDRLGLAPDARAVNICLLGVLPGYRRRGVARQILNQVVNAARSAE